LRPKDGKMPNNIAYVLCAGSRDETVGNPICSQICCMYSIKQAQLIMGALPMADVTIYYLHIRAFGKGFNEFYQQARSMGVDFVKGKVAKITEKENGNLIVRFEDVYKGKVKEAEHDLVVLSTGILANKGIVELFPGLNLETDPFNYVKQVKELENPSQTSIPGVFVAGTASGPMDIPDSILSAGAASSETASYIRRLS
jgi:heterodisulfide reductase subunit A